MIELTEEMLIIFGGGMLYFLIGIGISGLVSGEVDRGVSHRGYNPATWGLLVSATIALLWPLLVFLTVLTTGYATLAEVSE